MNRIDVRAIHHRGQYLAQFRRVHKAEFETVEKNGEPILYPTEDKAKLAAWEAMTAHLCTLMRRDGDRISNAKAAAERLFTRKANGQGEDESATSWAPEEDRSTRAERTASA